RTGDHSKAHVIATYDALFRDKKVRKTLKPDYVLRLGAMPISKSHRFLIEENEDAQQFVVEHGEEVREPTNHHSQYIFSDSIRFCKALIPLIKKSESEADWLKQWKVMDETIINILKQTDDVLTEGETVRIVSEDIKSNQALRTGNSTPGRDLIQLAIVEQVVLTVLHLVPLA